MWEQIGYIFLGWLLGLLAPVFAESVSKTFKRNSLIKALNLEMCNLHMIMTVVSYKINEHIDQMTDNFLNWFELQMKCQNKNSHSVKYLKLIDGLKKLSFEQRKVIRNTMGKEEALGLVTYKAQMLDANISELHNMEASYQSKLLDINNNLDFFNQLVMKYHEKLSSTFDSNLSSYNHQKVVQEIDEYYKNLEIRSRIIVDKISELLKFKP